MSELLNMADALNGVVARLHHMLRRAAVAAGGPPRPPDAQVELLRTVQRRPGISVKEAAEVLRTAANTVSTLVGELAEADLLTRTRDPDNRRVVRLELTAKARDQLDAYTGLRRAILGEALAALDASAIDELSRAVPHLLRLEELVAAGKAAVKH